MLVLYTNLNRKQHTVETFVDLYDDELDSLGFSWWPTNTSYWFVPGTLDPRKD